MQKFRIQVLYLLLILTRPTLKFGYNFTEIEISLILSLIQELPLNSDTLTNLFDVLLNRFESEKLYPFSQIDERLTPHSIPLLRWLPLDVSTGRSMSGGSLFWRVSARRVSVQQGGLCVCGVWRGGLCPEGDPLPLWTKWQTRVKTLHRPKIHL